MVGMGKEVRRGNECLRLDGSWEGGRVGGGRCAAGGSC